MRILFLGRYNQCEELRGPEKVARRIVDTMASLGHDVSFCEYYFSGEQYGRWTKLFGSESIRNSAGIDLRRVGIFPLLRMLFRLRMDMIHIITFERFAVLAVLARVFMKTPVVFTVHGIVQHEHAFFNKRSTKLLARKDSLIEGLIFKFADRLFFLSERSVAIASQYYVVPRAKVVIIANGIDGVFHSDSRLMNEGQPKPAIVFIGEPDRAEKGFDFFLRALRRCRQRADVFVVCETMPPQPVRVNSETNVHFVQKMETDAYAAFLHGKGVYVSASQYDPFSISAVEAMAAGLVPVVTEETGMSRYIKNGVNGFVIPFGDEDLFAETIDRLVGDGELRIVMSANASSVYPLLTWDVVAKEYAHNYPWRSFQHNQ